jgi:two-component system LytT family sensor kinase
VPDKAAVISAVGLSNTAARLAELYGEKSRFSLDSSPGGGVTATIEIPFRVPTTNTGSGNAGGEQA